MNKLIIVEGPQGVGKTTYTNWLREQITSTNLFRLSGVKDLTMGGLGKSITYHTGLLNYFKQISQCDLNLVLDRSFVSEEVYCVLGYKPYSFTISYQSLLENLDHLKYDKYIFNLHCSPDELEKRLRRDKPVYMDFSLTSSLRQQEVYYQKMEEIKSRTKNIKVINVDADKDEVVKQLFIDILQIQY